LMAAEASSFSPRHLPRSAKTRQLFSVLLLILATAFVFRDVVNHDFVAWDDSIHVYENPFINPPTLNKTLHFWKQPHEGLYIPVTYSVWSGLALLSSITGSPGEPILRPRVFHLFNLLIHMCNVLLVFALLRGLLLSEGASCCGALLFAVHPAQVESVAWVSELKGLLCAFFALLAIRAYVSFAQTIGRPAWWKWLLALVCYLLALLSKPAAVSLPAIIWLLDCGYLRNSQRKATMTLLPWVVLAAAFVLLTRQAQPVPESVVRVSLPSRLLVAGDAVSFYLSKLTLPIRLCADYGRDPQYVMQHRWSYLFAGVVLLLMVLAWGARKRFPHLALAFAVFLVALLPVSGLIPFAYQQYSTVADRYLYLAMLGPALALGAVVTRPMNYGIPCLLGVALGLLGYVSHAQVAYWQNDFALNERILAVNRRSIPGNNNLGITLLSSGKYEQAARCYRTILSALPGDYKANLNMGKLRIEQGRYAEATSFCSRALGTSPDAPEAHYHLARALEGQGEMAAARFEYLQAATYFEKERAVKPAHFSSMNNLAIALERIGEKAEARRHYLWALQINPNYAHGWLNLGALSLTEGRVAEGITCLQRAVRLKPDFVEAWTNLGAAHLAQGDVEESAISYRRALEFNPSYAPARRGLERTRQHMPAKQPSSGEPQ